MASHKSVRFACTGVFSKWTSTMLRSSKTVYEKLHTQTCHPTPSYFGYFQATSHRKDTKSQFAFLRTVAVTNTFQLHRSKSQQTQKPQHQTQMSELFFGIVSFIKDLIQRIEGMALKFKTNQKKITNPIYT